MTTYVKECKYCGAQKPFDPTQTRYSRASGFKGLRCWDCQNEVNRVRTAEWYAKPENKEAHRITTEKYRGSPEGAEATRLSGEKCRTKNIEKYREASRLAAARAYATPEGRAKAIKKSLEWAKNNPGKVNAQNLRYYMGRRRRTMLWTEHEEIKAFYIKACQLDMAVDHGIPLKGKDCSGLHVLANLRLLTKSENSRKGNRRDLEWERSLGYHVG